MPEERLELSRCFAPLDFESSAYTNFATQAVLQQYYRIAPSVPKISERDDDRNSRALVLTIITANFRDFEWESDHLNPN